MEDEYSSHITERGEGQGRALTLFYVDLIWGRVDPSQEGKSFYHTEFYIKAYPAIED